MRVVSADSGAAILDDKFQPVNLVASVSVMVEPPYREASLRLAEPIFREVESDFEIIVHEAELCSSLLGKVSADVVQLDMSLGGFSIEELSPVELVNLRASRTGRQKILKILPRLRRLLAKLSGCTALTCWLLGKRAFPCVLLS